MLDFEAGGSSICEEREGAGRYSPYPFSYRALAFGRPQNDGTRSFYFETTSMSGEIFIALHLGSYQDVFHYLKTRCCLFCRCANYI